MSGYPMIKPFVFDASDNTQSRDLAVLAERGRHNETLNRLGDLYYVRCKELETEKQKK